MTAQWMKYYLPPDPSQWQGRKDHPADSNYFQIMQMMNLLDHTPTRIPDVPNFALIGFRSDEGVRRNHGRVGAVEGPASIRQALGKLPIQKQNFVCMDAGNIMCPDGDLEGAQKALGDVVAIFLEKKIHPIVLGGGHELAWGNFQGITQAFPKEQLGIVNFDAHFDMRPFTENHGTSGTSFLQIAKYCEQHHIRFDYNCIGIQHVGNIRQLFETAKNYNTHVILADELHQPQLEKCADFIDRIIDENHMIYMSLCLDVFGVAFAPGVSAIQPLGVCPWHVIPLVRQLAASGKVISYDIAELCPRYDIDHRTAKLAAILIYEITHHHQHL